jgi:hypothetical protein
MRLFFIKNACKTRLRCEIVSDMPFIENSAITVELFVYFVFFV